MTAALGGPRVPADLPERWMDRWAEAMGLWSRFTRLRQPVLCTTAAQARAEGLSQSFAMIRLVDQTIVIDLQMVVALGMADQPLAVMGHEIGHHIAAPATLLTNGRAVARMRVALPGVEDHAPLLSNLYADLLINDKLHRDHGLDVAALYRAINDHRSTGSSALWEMYQRTYEILWALPRGSLSTASVGDTRLEGDAQLCARLVRSYASRWVDGAGRFAALCFPYLVTDDGARTKGQLTPAEVWGDAVDAGAGSRIPAGLSSSDPDELEGAIHPAVDPALNGLGSTAGQGEVPDTDPAGSGRTSGGAGGAGQRREPFEYGQLLRALGMDLTDHEVAVRFYREQAGPHLIRFPTAHQPVRGETLPEGYSPWSPGEALEDVDWVQSVLGSPVVIPGVTTVQRVYGVDELAPPRPVPLHLDLYVDSSGSMPDPQQQLSYPALAATVIAMSALRAGARVQATLWSGAGQFRTTDGFTDDRDGILRVVLGHIGGGTAFPLHVLRDTYAHHTPQDPPVHILVISDDGITTTFADDEQGTAGAEVMRDALAAARGGGTWALQLFRRPKELADGEALGWRVEPVTTMEELVAFARRFAATAYAPAVGGPRG